MGTEGADKHSGSTAANEQKDMEQKEHKLPTDFPRGMKHAMLLVGGRWPAGACHRQHIGCRDVWHACQHVVPTHLYAGLRVLVVDDDPLCLKITEQMLKRCNYEGAGGYIAQLSGQQRPVELYVLHMPFLAYLLFLKLAQCVRSLLVTCSSNSSSSRTATT
jgi:hypothetical protein